MITPALSDRHNGRFYLLLFVLIALIILIISQTTQALSLEKTNRMTLIEKAPSTAAISSRPKNQHAPAVAYHPSRNEYLVVWEEAYSPTDYDIYVQRTDAAGNPLATALALATSGLMEEAPQVVHSHEADLYLVVWQYEAAPGNHDIYARIVNGDGTAGPAATVVAGSSADEQAPAVAYDRVSRQFLIVWQQNAGSDSDIYGRLLDIDGNTVTPAQEFSASPSDQTRPAVVFAPTLGHYLVVFEEDNGGNSDISGRLVGDDGLPQGIVLAISTATGQQARPRVAHNEVNKTYFVVWEDTRDGTSDIYGQPVGDDGSNLGSNMLIAGSGSNGRFLPDVAHDTVSGEFVIVYQVVFSASDDDIRRARVHPDGTVLDAGISVAARSTNERQPTVAVTGNHASLIVWSDDQNSTTTGWDIYGTPAAIPELWTFRGVVTNVPGNPLPDVQVRLLGSDVSGVPGQILGWDISDANGNFEIIYYPVSEGYDGFPVLQMLLIDPAYNVETAVSGDGGVNNGQGWLEFTNLPSGVYASNTFEVDELYLVPGPPSVRLCAVADSWIRQGDPEALHGADTILQTAYQSGSTEADRTLALFDLSTLPEKGVLQGAKLQAYLTGGSGEDLVDLEIWQVETPWLEENVSWNLQPATSQPTLIAQTIDQTPGYHEWDVTPIVQSWQNGTVANHGLALLGPEGGPDWTRSWESRENSHPPQLVLTYGGVAAFAPPPSKHNPAITLRANRGGAGDPFMVTGFNLKPGIQYNVYWDENQPANKLATVTANNLGAFALQVTVPITAVDGAHPVLVYFDDPIEQIHRLEAQSTFLVETNCLTKAPSPQISLSSHQGPSNGGNTIQVLGSGWTATTTVQLSWESPALCATQSQYCLGQVTTDGQGKFLTDVVIPTWAGAIDHEIVARNTPFTVPVQQAIAAYRLTDPPTPPAGDVLAPTLAVGFNWITPYSGGPPVGISFAANASDPLTTPSAYNGVVRVELWAYAMGATYPALHRVCEVEGWTPTLSCYETGGSLPSSLVGFFYYAQAEDRSGNVATSPIKFAWRTDGPDSDNDNLADVVENSLCTDPNNPDTDRDNLLDGWEIFGYRFPGETETIDLPAMGAHPCTPDMFVEIDWRPGFKPNWNVDIQPVINAFQREGLALHVDTGQWGGGTEISATLKQPWKTEFDPNRYWSFHYMVFQNNGVCVRGKYAEIESRNGETFMHELGHCMSLGHGGTTGPNTQQRSGSGQQQTQWGFQWVWYDQDTDTQNNKPNYLSMMNYSWNGLIFDAANKRTVYKLDFSHSVLPTLDESDLDERASSPFIQALRAYPKPPSAPAGDIITMYACKDPRENDDIIIYGTNGLRPVVRGYVANKKLIWDYDTLPTQNADGIDWDCDGVIEASVATNINGDDFGRINAGTWVPDQVLAGSDDWEAIPSIDPCLGDTAFGNGYLKAAHNPPCESSGWAVATTSRPIQSSGDLQLPPGEFCNGLDDDDDTIIDEGCVDQDNDLVTDDLDNCPTVANASQQDVNQDGLGDACALPPAAPAGVHAQTAGNLVHLVWEPVNDPDLLGYNVYRWGPGEQAFTFIGDGWPTLTETVWLDQVASAGPVAYQIHAVRSDWMESAASETTGTWGLTITANGNDAILAWNENGLAETYKVYQATNPYAIIATAVWSDTQPAPTSPWLIPGGAGNPAQNYFYIVQAIWQAGMVTAPSRNVGSFNFTVVPDGP